MRYGGATHKRLCRKSIKDVMSKYRWTSDQTLKLYLNMQQALLVKIGVTPQLQVKIRELTSRWYRSKWEDERSGSGLQAADLL